MTMKIETRMHNGYAVLSFLEDVALTSDISDLRDMISQYLDRDVRKIAIRFTSQSYLSSKSVGILLQCVESIREAGGKMAVISPNADITDVLSTVYFSELVDSVSSLDELSDR